MTEYMRASLSDFEEIRDESNQIFTGKETEAGFDYDRTYFQDLLPKLYGNDERTEQHYIARENGKIVGIVGAFESKVSVNGELLENRGIGTVGVDRNHRREGHMIKLMNMAMSDMEKDGVAFSALGGIRHRYGHWGYAPTGICYSCRFGRSCVKYLYDRQDYGFSFSYMDSPDDEILDRIYSMYSALPVHTVRSRSRLFDILVSWKQKIIVISREGAFFGYCLLSGDSHINEMWISDDSVLGECLTDLLGFLDRGEISIEIPQYDTSKLSILAQINSGFNIICSEMIRVIDHRKTMAAYMNVKLGNAFCPDMAYGIEITGKDRFSLVIENGRAYTEELKREPDISLSERDASLYFYGPSSGCPGVPSVFPVPLFVASSDKV